MTTTFRDARAAALALLLLTTPAWGQAPFSECLPPAHTGYVTGVVECQRIGSAALGAEAPFSYYIPPACTTESRCPALYLFHGTGGSYRSYLGAKGGSPTALILALDHEPPVDLATVSDPWSYQSDTWVPAAPLDFVLVAPHNRTLPGGYGPAEGMDGLWGDWNPRYAEGGEEQQYDTPPPRFETHVVDELIPFVEARLPVEGGRGWRATLGTSQGGFGALKLPLQHPDLFAAATSLSGGTVPVGWLARIPGLPGGIASPAPVPAMHLPGVFPMFDYPPESNYLVVPSIMIAYGDPVADNVYLVSEMPGAIASNARAWQDGRQSVAFRLKSNDAIPRRVEDFAEPQSYLASQGYELLTYQTTREMTRVFDVNEVEYRYEVHPGLHGGPYQSPWYRQAFEFLWENVLRPDGSGEVVSVPDVFDYRTIRKELEVWGWRFSVEREAVEFLDVLDASCAGITLRGSGVVTFEVPATCGTGSDGSPVVTVDLGPSQATDEPGHVSWTGLYGRTVTIALAPLP